MNQKKRPLIAVDANFAFDLAEPKEFALDSLQIIRDRLSPARMVVPPTAGQEIVFISRFAETEREREQARTALRGLRKYGLDLLNLIPVEHGIAERIAARLEAAGLLPVEERNDGLILAEAALLNCTILLTSDAHLRGIDFQRASFELRSFDLSLPIIATPREIIAKFG